MTPTQHAKQCSAGLSRLSCSLLQGKELASTLLAIASIVASADLRAQSVAAASAGGLDEIVVTAERRSETLQRVPISMDAISGVTLDNLGAKHFDDFAMSIPNLSVGMATGAGGSGSGFGVSSTRSVTIRGVAGDNTTGFYLNDTPLPLSIDPRVLDIDHIEVLRGPQGTLFGSGSMGGTVRLITRQPALDAFSGRVDVEGSHVSLGGGGYSADGILNVPLIEGSVAMRLSAFSAYEPGYFTRKWGYVTSPAVPLPAGAPIGEKSGVGASQNTGIMFSLAIAPSSLPGLSITPTFIYQRSVSNGYPLADFTPTNADQIRPLDVPEAVDDTWDFAGLSATYKAAFGRFIGNATYFYRNAFDLEDGTEFTSAVFPGGLANYVAAPLPTNLYTKTVNGEVRFESSFSGPVQVVVGMFSERAAVRFFEPYLVDGLNAASGGIVGTDLAFYENAPNVNRQLAEFVNVTWDVTAALQLTAGVRRAHLSHDFSRYVIGYQVGPPFETFGFHEENDTAPRFTAKYQFTPDEMAYASAGKGFRIGGSNAILPSICNDALATVGITNGAPFNSDSLWSYELGLKSAWLDNRIKSRLAIYRIDWKGIQQTTTLGAVDPTCTFNVTTNSGAATSTGGELEVDAAPMPNLTLNFTTGYENAKITASTPGSLTVVGQPINEVPKLTASTTVQYSIPLGERSLFIRGQDSYTDYRKSFVNVAPPVGRSLAPYNLVNLRVGFDQGPWEAALFARNLFDVRANLGDVNAEVGELPGRPRWLIATPRTIGLQLRRSF